MCVPRQHLQALVPGDSPYFHQVQIRMLKEPAGGLVAQIVQVQCIRTPTAGNARIQPGTAPCTVYAVCSPSKDGSGQVVRGSMESASRAAGERGTVRASPFFVFGR